MNKKNFTLTSNYQSIVRTVYTSNEKYEVFSQLISHHPYSCLTGETIRWCGIWVHRRKHQQSRTMIMKPVENVEEHKDNLANNFQN